VIEAQQKLNSDTWGHEVLNLSLIEMGKNQITVPGRKTPNPILKTGIDLMLNPPD